MNEAKSINHGVVIITMIVAIAVLILIFLFANGTLRLPEISKVEEPIEIKIYDIKFKNCTLKGECYGSEEWYKVEVTEREEEKSL